MVRQSTINSASLGQPGVHAQKCVCEDRGAEKGIAEGKRLGGCQQLSNAKYASVLQVLCWPDFQDKHTKLGGNSSNTVLLDIYDLLRTQRQTI
jgi:hypothetical protein